MLGLNISSAFNSAVTIYISIPFLIIPQLLLAGVVVKFDKLNPVLAKQGGVPVVGEMMASRWAFEALAVNQFKANKYQKNYYKFEKAISISSYKKVYWIPKLQNKMVKIDNELKEKTNIQELERDFILLKNELLKEQAYLKNKYKFEGIDQLNANDYTPAIALSLKQFLAKINEHYINFENKARKQEDEVTQKLIKKLGNDKFIELKDDYTNEALDQFMLNSNDLGDRCLEHNGRLIQRIEPIYLDPTESNFGSAHFYAPNKRFMGNLIPTYWFNISVIWLMSISLMVMLYFDVFKKALDLLGNISFKRKK
jgi:hypothetical protein